MVRKSTNSESLRFHLAPGPLDRPSGRFMTSWRMGTPCDFASASLLRLKAMLCTCSEHQAHQTPLGHCTIYLLKRLVKVV